MRVGAKTNEKVNPKRIRNCIPFLTTPHYVRIKELRPKRPMTSSYSEGQGDLVSRLIMGVRRVVIWIIGVLTYLPSPPDPPRKGYNPTFPKSFAFIPDEFDGLLA